MNTIKEKSYKYLVLIRKRSNSFVRTKTHQLLDGFFCLLRFIYYLCLMEILKNKIVINELFEKGKYLSNGVVMIKFLESESTSFLFAVSSKKFKRAVDRNRIKRLMKECVRKLTINNKNIAFVYIGEGVPTFEVINNSITNLLSKI